MSEKILFVDENDQPIGSGTREEAWAKGVHHRITRVILRDENGKILSQLRSKNKKLYPNRWTDSASGHVDEGEDYEDAMVREMREEIGVETNLKFVGKFLSHHTNFGVETPVFNAIFEGVIDSSTKLNLQESEVADFAWYELEALKLEMNDNPDKFTPGFVEAFRRYY